MRKATLFFLLATCCLPTLLLAQNKTWYDPITGFTFEEFTSKSDGKTYVHAGNPEPHSIAAHSFLQAKSAGTFGPLYKVGGEKIKSLEDLKKALNGKYTSVAVEDYYFPWEVQKNPQYKPSGRTMPLLLPNPPGQRAHPWGECVTGNCDDGYSELKASDGYLYRGVFVNKKSGQGGVMVTPSGKKWDLSFSKKVTTGFEFVVTLPNPDAEKSTVWAEAEAFSPGTARVTKIEYKGGVYYPTPNALSVEEFSRKRFSDLQPFLKTQSDVDKTFSGVKSFSEKLRLPGWNEMHTGVFSRKMEAGKDLGTESIGFILTGLTTKDPTYYLLGAGLMVNNGKISGKNIRLVDAGKTVMTIEAMRNDTLIGKVNMNNYPFFKKWASTGTFQYTADQNGLVVGNYSTEFTGVDQKWERFVLTAEQPIPLRQAEQSMDWVVGSYYHKHAKNIKPEEAKLPFSNAQEEILYYLDLATKSSKDMVKESGWTIVAEGQFTGDSRVHFTTLESAAVLTVSLAYPKHSKVDVVAGLSEKCNCTTYEVGPIIQKSCHILNLTLNSVEKRVNIYLTGKGPVSYVLHKGKSK